MKMTQKIPKSIILCVLLLIVLISCFPLEACSKVEKGECIYDLRDDHYEVVGTTSKNISSLFNIIEYEQFEIKLHITFLLSSKTLSVSFFFKSLIIFHAVSFPSPIKLNFGNS